MTCCPLDEVPEPGRDGRTKHKGHEDSRDVGEQELALDLALRVPAGNLHLVVLHERILLLEGNRAVAGTPVVLIAVLFLLRWCCCWWRRHRLRWSRRRFRSHRLRLCHALGAPGIGKLSRTELIQLRQHELLCRVVVAYLAPVHTAPQACGRRDMRPSGFSRRRLFAGTGSARRLEGLEARPLCLFCLLNGLALSFFRLLNGLVSLLIFGRNHTLCRRRRLRLEQFENQRDERTQGRENQPAKEQVVWCRRQQRCTAEERQGGKMNPAGEGSKDRAPDLRYRDAEVGENRPVEQRPREGDAGMLIPPTLCMPDVPLVCKPFAQRIPAPGRRSEEIPEQRPGRNCHSAIHPVFFRLGRRCRSLLLLLCEWRLRHRHLLSIELV